MIYPQATAPNAVANPLLGLGPGLGALKSIDPITLSSCLWDFDINTTIYSDIGGTTPATVGSAVKNWANRKSGVSVTAATENVGGLLLTAAGIRTQDAGNLVLNTSVTLSGVFTAYLLGDYSGTTLHFAGRSTGDSIQFYNASIYVIDAAMANINTATSATGRKLYRVRRNASSVCYFAASGVAETTIGTKSGDIILNALFARPGVDQTFDAQRVERLTMFSEDLVTTGQAGGVEQKIVGAAI